MIALDVVSSVWTRWLSIEHGAEDLKQTDRQFLIGTGTLTDNQTVRLSYTHKSSYTLDPPLRELHVKRTSPMVCPEGLRDDPAGRLRDTA